MRRTSKTPAKSKWKRHNIVLGTETRQRGQEMADQDDRSFSNFINRLIDAEHARRRQPEQKAA